MISDERLNQLGKIVAVEAILGKIELSVSMEIQRAFFELLQLRQQLAEAEALLKEEE